MNINIKESIIKDMPIGYALHQFIKDENGLACDYMYIDINIQMESITNLSASEIIGKKASEVLPRLFKDDSDWIQTYAKVAFEGEKVQFTLFSKPLDKWLKIAAYSPEPGYFVTLIEDITEEKNLENQNFKIQQVVKRQETIIEIYNKNITDKQEFLSYVLHRAKKFLKSQYGYIFYNDNDKGLTLNTWTDGILTECDVLKSMGFQLKKTGPWKEVVNKRKPVIINNLDEQSTIKSRFPKVHVPIKNFMSIPVMFDNQIVAIVGLANSDNDYTDYDANELMLLMQSAWFIFEAKTQTAIREEEREKYSHILNKLPVLFCEFDVDSRLNYVNKSYCDYFKLDKKDLIGKKFLDFIPKSQREKVKQLYLELTPENPVVQYTHQVKRGKDIRWMEWQDAAVYDDSEQLVTYYSIGFDVTEKVVLELKEREELTQLKAAIEDHRAIIFFIEPKSGKILYANHAATNFYGYVKDELLNMSIQEINMLGEDVVRKLRNRASKSSQHYFTFPHRLKNGEIRMVEAFSCPINYSGKKVLFSIIFDVTDKEKVMKEIKYLVYHDHLTGVYNRRYFEETYNKLNKKENQPLAIIMGDINGLRMVNYTYGYMTGDALIKEAVRYIKEYIPKDSILARIGGDEFIVLISKTTEKEVAQITNTLEEQLERDIQVSNHNRIDLYLSVSFGYGIQTEDRQSMDDLIKQAETYANRRKYYNQMSTRSHMISAMLSTLFQKSEREQKHSERVGAYCQAIAKALKWDTERLNTIRAAGNLHDIGKIGVDESILNKPGTLNDDEWEIMIQHPVKSAKILEEVEEYEEIIDIVRSHHEKLDGTGYPNGLKGDKIPVEAKIIAVADAYDAMTEDRTYKKSMNKEEAIAELYRCSGTQFDPEIVDIFVNKVLKKAKENTGTQKGFTMNEHSME